MLFADILYIKYLTWYDTAIHRCHLKSIFWHVGTFASGRCFAQQKNKKDWLFFRNAGEHQHYEEKKWSAIAFL